MKSSILKVQPNPNDLALFKFSFICQNSRPKILWKYLQKISRPKTIVFIFLLGLCSAYGQEKMNRFNQS